MRLSTLFPSRIPLLGVLAGGVLLGGCANDAMAPAAPSAELSRSVSSPFVPTAAARSLVGVADGTYTFTVDPTRTQSLVLGANLLYLPAHAICDVATSSYGATHWNESCAPQTEPLVITAVVKNAGGARPSINFFPAMRFSPDKNVSLYMYVPKAERARHGKVAPTFLMNYCNDRGACVDESLTDPSLVTMTDRSNSIAFRRIKHFSGYFVTALMEETASAINDLF